MKYKFVSNSKKGKYKLPYRELKIEADEIPEITLTGEQYLYIDTDNGSILVDAKWGKLEITIHNPSNNKVKIDKSRKTELEVNDF